MDKISFAGLILSIGAVLGGQVLEGGHLGSLIQLTAFLIVMGGTAGAVMLQSSPATFFRGLKLAAWAFRPPIINRDKQLKQIVEWAQSARKGGLLALESQLEMQTDRFTRKGLQMLVDGAEPESLRHTLEIEKDNWLESEKLAAKIWESAGGYSPTVGILGAVLGLIHVMENLSDPSKLGAGIAVAFVATVYGVGSANLLFLPIANKLKYWINQISLGKEMMIVGLTCIAHGENHRIIEGKLQAYL